jgi:hypothetical protein
MPRKLPNNIHIRRKSDGRRVYRVLIRRKGVAPYSREFAKLADALAARDARLGLLIKTRSGGTPSTITVREAIASYRCGIWYRQLAKPATMDVGLRYWDRQFGQDEAYRSLGTPPCGRA